MEKKVPKRVHYIMIQRETIEKKYNIICFENQNTNYIYIVYTSSMRTKNVLRINIGSLMYNYKYILRTCSVNDARLVTIACNDNNILLHPKFTRILPLHLNRLWCIMFYSNQYYILTHLFGSCREYKMRN